MVVGKRRDLRDMSDADDLIESGYRFELAAYFEGRLAADATIDFIEEIYTNAPFVRYHASDGQHQTR
jgi:hypothetical protein